MLSGYYLHIITFCITVKREIKSLIDFKLTTVAFTGSGVLACSQVYNSWEKLGVQCGPSNPRGFELLISMIQFEMLIYVSTIASL